MTPEHEEAVRLEFESELVGWGNKLERNAGGDYKSTEVFYMWEGYRQASQKTAALIADVRRQKGEEDAVAAKGDAKDGCCFACDGRIMAEAAIRARLEEGK